MEFLDKFGCDSTNLHLDFNLVPSASFCWNEGNLDIALAARESDFVSN